MLIRDIAVYDDSKLSVLLLLLSLSFFLSPLSSSHTHTCPPPQFLVMTLRDPSFQSRIPVSSTLDPFLPSQLHPSHIVTSISTKHTLILNKFYTINEHSILITKQYERQETLLNLQDIEAWFFCISSIKALGFYNSNSDAGASQPHKHMQLIPLNEIRNLSPTSTYTLPIDISIRSRIIRKEWKYFFPFSTDYYNTGARSSSSAASFSADSSATTASTSSSEETSYVEVLEGASQYNVYHIPEYHFKHALIALIGSSEWDEVMESTKISASYSDYLVAAYHQLLFDLQLTSSLTSREWVALGGYNVLLTERWMMLVCRQQESFSTYSSISSLTHSQSNGAISFNGIDIDRGTSIEAKSLPTSTSAASLDTGMGEVQVASVNGLGFAGLLLARSPLAMSIIREKSPLAVLQGVSVPIEQ